jgi:hypothetical protein
MFASATSGERPNNSRFSNCSVGNISSVLDAIEEGKKKNCFTGKSVNFITYRLLYSVLDLIVNNGVQYVCGFLDSGVFLFIYFLC